MNVNDWYLFQGVGNVIGFHRVVGPRLMGLTPDEAAIEAAMPKAHAVFAELARLLGEQPYLRRRYALPRRPPGRAAGRLLQRDAEWAALGAPHANLVGVAVAHGGAAEHAGDHLGARLEMAKVA